MVEAALGETLASSRCPLRCKVARGMKSVVDQRTLEFLLRVLGIAHVLQRPMEQTAGEQEGLHKTGLK